jgi:3-oxoacyl-[acyl-carrier protein] reductase
MNGPLSGLRALVTGAYGTLGTAICQRLRADGAALLLVGRSADRLQDLAAALAAASPGPAGLEILAVDLAAPDAVERITATVAAGGGLDLLVNNAAIQGPIGPLWENDWEAWQETIRLDLLVPVALCRSLVGQFGRDGRRGKIVNISGGGATGPRPNFSAYGVAKAALVRFTETFAHEVRERAIDINAIAPGALASQMTQAILAAGTVRAGNNEAATARKAAAGDGTAQNTAAALVGWLASGASDGVTGRLLAALWDPWPTLDQRVAELAASDIYTLRRIVPEDRGRRWE